MGLCKFHVTLDVYTAQYCEIFEFDSFDIVFTFCFYGNLVQC